MGLFVVVVGLITLSGCFLFPNRAPVADFTISYQGPSEPFLVLLDASSSNDPDEDEIVDYMWTTTADGVTITEIAPMDTTATVHVPQITIQFNLEDSYDVTLAVRDARGKISIPVTKTVTVPHDAS